MSTGKLSSTLLLLLLFCVKFSHSGVKKIKIHVPYYVKHVHHYKKVYVPKIHVIKHEHHHKKEYDHHHHHHEIFKHGPYRSYDKSSLEYPDDFYYDDIESKSYRGGRRKRIKPYRYQGRYSEQYKGWKDVDGSDYSGEEEEDYATYRKNYYFKRRSGTDEDDDEETPNTEEEQEQEEEEQESEEVEEEDEDQTTPTDKEEIISITTTAKPLH